MKFTFSVSKTQIDQAYQQALSESAKKITLKGFRKGKAPLKLAEEKIGKSKLQRTAIENVIPNSYSKAIKQQKLKPITYPEIELKTVEKNGDWVFQAQIAQKPIIKLGNYTQALKAAAFKQKTQNPKIWLPGEEHKTKSSSSNEASNSSEDPSLKLVFDTLLETINFKIPKFLIAREVARSLSKLIEQLERLGLTMDDYLASINKTPESLKSEYAKTATDSLKLEFLLQEIAEDQKITVTDSEVDQFIKSIPNQDPKNNLDSNESRLNLKLILLKRKTVNRLLSFTQ